VRYIRMLAGAAIWAAVLTLAASSADEVPPDAAYRQSFERWKGELVDDLKQNWLRLAGLFWLKPGENSFGTDAKNSIVFPKGPTHAGSFEMRGRDVTLQLAPGVQANVDEEPISSVKLEADITGNPTVVKMGSLQFNVIVRGERVGIRLKDLASKSERRYPGPQFFPIDMRYLVSAKWEPAEAKKTIDVPNVLGDVTATPVAGAAVFTINGQEFRLTDLRGDPSKGLFLVFSDLTSKTQTYPGGRFLQTEPVANSTVLLDFNRAYNPPCAVTPYATCPLAPKENRLTVAIPAGEKYDHQLNH
jgi:uncharacterized protein